MERFTRNSDQVSFQDTTTIVSQLFDRYDVDDSGTMVRRCLSRRLLRGFVVQNDSDELVQLSVNVCFKLNLHTLQAAEVTHCALVCCGGGAETLTERIT